MGIVASLPYADQLRTAVYFSKTFGLGKESRKILAGYLTGQLFPEYSDDVHLKAAMEWLARAQDVCGGRGVSNVFYFNGGWGVAYPETSGYILATYLAFADYSGDKSYLDRAIQIGDWEIDIQAPNGGVLSSELTRQTRVFNTGQVILGWCALFERTGDDRYLQAAIKAGDYLLEGQESDGAWRNDTYCGARTYHSRVDWGLLRLGVLSGESKYIDTAEKNLKWVLSQQKDNGWFDQCGFNDELPIMHVIVYTLRGLLESSMLNLPQINKLDIFSAVVKAADALCHALQEHPVKGVAGMVPTAFDSDWQGKNKDSCLTGNVQLACFLYRLSHATGNQYYRQIADSAVSATKRTQLVETSMLPLRGGVAGTYPISHGYVPNGFPNWATKFFADALLMKIGFAQKLAILA